MSEVSNDIDHARIRKLLSHAFSETALREQEPALNTYFDLFISRLKDQIDKSVAGKVDIMSWYNFASFDIIGSVIRSTHLPIAAAHCHFRDLSLGESFHALEKGELHSWMRYFIKTYNGILVSTGVEFP